MPLLWNSELFPSNCGLQACSCGAWYRIIHSDQPTEQARGQENGPLDWRGDPWRSLGLRRASDASREAFYEEPTMAGKLFSRRHAPLTGARSGGVVGVPTPARHYFIPFGVLLVDPIGVLLVELDSIILLPLQPLQETP